MPYLAGVKAFVSSVTGIIILALLAALIALSLYVWGFHIAFIGFDGLTEKLSDCRANLKAISDKRNEQKPITQTNVEKARESDQSAHRIKERIIAAPDTKNCETPPIIMGADL